MTGGDEEPMGFDDAPEPRHQKHDNGGRKRERRDVGRRVELSEKLERGLDKHKHIGDGPQERVIQKAVLETHKQRRLAAPEQLAPMLDDVDQLAPVSRHERIQRQNLAHPEKQPRHQEPIGRLAIRLSHGDAGRTHRPRQQHKQNVQTKGAARAHLIPCPRPLVRRRQRRRCRK